MLCDNRHIWQKYETVRLILIIALYALYHSMRQCIEKNVIPAVRFSVVGVTNPSLSLFQCSIPVTDHYIFLHNNQFSYLRYRHSPHITSVQCHVDEAHTSDGESHSKVLISNPFTAGSFFRQRPRTGVIGSATLCDVIIRWFSLWTTTAVQLRTR